MDRQDVFDRVARHLLRQGRKAEDPETKICRYRASDGSKCAIGCLIPDEKYEDWMEGNVIRNLVEDDRFPFPEWRGDSNGEFLQRLQRIHDSYTTDKWAEKLQAFALERGLSYAAVCEFEGGGV